MQLKEIMTPNPEEIPVTGSVMHAAERMKKLDVGIIPVFSDHEVVGVVTDRDIVVRAVAENKDLSHTSVKDIMSKDVISCPENTDVEEAAQIMEKNRVRRLIVTNDRGETVGIVSLGDIATKTRQLDTAGEVLERVSKPSHPQR